jgi:hypothetical protein
MFTGTSEAECHVAVRGGIFRAFPPFFPFLASPPFPTFLLTTFFLPFLGFAIESREEIEASESSSEDDDPDGVFACLRGVAFLLKAFFLGEGEGE